MILTEVAFKGDIVLGHLRWESFVSLVDHLLLGLLTTFILHVLDSSIQLVFKHSDGLDRVLLDVVSQVSISHSEFVQGERKSVLTLADQLLDSFGSVACAHELVNLGLHAFLHDSRSIGACVLCSINLHNL